MAKILNFPIKADIPVTKTGAQQRIQAVRTEFCDEVLEECLRNLVQNITAYGFTFKSEGAHQKDLIMLSEVMQATLYRYSGLDHPMQDVILELIKFDDEDDEPKKKPRKKRAPKKDVDNEGTTK